MTKCCEAMSYHLGMDVNEKWSEVVRLLAVGIAMEQGHTMSCISKPYQPGPNTMRLAREMLDEANRDVDEHRELLSYRYDEHREFKSTRALSQEKD